MRIKINWGLYILSGNRILSVNLYKTKEAYCNPTENPDECLGCDTIVDFDFSSKLSLSATLIQTIEASVNQLLNYEDKKII